MVNMKFYREQRVCVLVDVQNMYYSAKNLYNSKVKFNEILKDALDGRKLIRAIAYAIKADVKDEKNFHEALEKIGFEVKTKDLLVFYGGHKKGDWDIGIAMDAVRAAEKVDVIVVVSGDGDFKELYEYVRGKGCRVEVMAFGRTASSSIKGYADLFIDMDNKAKYLISLKGKKRPAQSGNSKDTPKNTTQQPKTNNLGSNSGSAARARSRSRSESTRLNDQARKDMPSKKSQTNRKNEPNQNREMPPKPNPSRTGPPKINGAQTPLLHNPAMKTE